MLLNTDPLYMYYNTFIPFVLWRYIKQKRMNTAADII